MNVPFINLDFESEPLLARVWVYVCFYVVFVRSSHNEELYFRQQAKALTQAAEF